MAEPKYTIYNSSNEKVCWSKHSVMWVGNCEERLGDFYENEVFDSSQKQIAYVKDNVVFTMKGQELGRVKLTSFVSDSGSDLEATALVIGGKKVGRCFPKHSKVALAGIALLAARLESDTK